MESQKPINLKKMNEEAIIIVKSIGEQMDNCIKRKQKESILNQVESVQEIIILKPVDSIKELDARSRSVMNFIINPKI